MKTIWFFNATTSLALTLAACCAQAGLLDNLPKLTLDQRLPVGQGMNRLYDLRRQRRQQHVEVVHRLSLPLSGSHAGLASFSLGHRTPAGTRRGSATRTRVSFMSSVTTAIDPNPSSSSRRSIGPS